MGRTPPPIPWAEPPTHPKLRERRRSSGTRAPGEISPKPGPSRSSLPGNSTTHLETTLKSVPVNTDALFIWFVEFLPRRGLSRLARHLSRIRSRWAVRYFAAAYGIAVHEAERPLDEYSSVFELFTRRLAPGARPVDSNPGALVSPVDATVGAYGHITAGQLVQAKGRVYTLSALLAQEAPHPSTADGRFATLYLSPRDYHRVHSPAAGILRGYTYVPGDLYPVNAPAVARVDQLFARNERLVLHLDSSTHGPVEVVMVGATNVGHMTLAADPELRARCRRRELLRHTFDPPIPVERGDELGVFELGSTVVLILDPSIDLHALETLATPRVGQAIGHVVGPATDD